jgi:hypothetical protein
MSGNIINKNIQTIQEYELKKEIMKKFIEKKKKIPFYLIKETNELKKKLKLLGIKEGDYTIRMENQKGFDNRVKEEYKEYKKVEKYIGDKKLDKACHYIIHNQDTGETKEFNEDINKEYLDIIKSKKKGVCFTWHHTHHGWAWVDKDIMNKQFKMYKKLIKKGTILCQDCNLPTKELLGKKWYGLVINGNDENPINMDVGSIRLFSYFVNGLVYWFPIKENRDKMFNWINGN